MNGRSGSNSVMAAGACVRATVVVASAIAVAVALAGCVPSGSGGASPSPSSTPTVSASASSYPVPTPEPLIIPGCETFLPLTTAKSLFSDYTEVLGDDNSVPIYGHELPEVATAASNASIAKNCVWGVPNSDGAFSLSITDITDTDAANLTAALLATGFLGVTTGGVTALEFSAETTIGTSATTHYLVGDLWISVTGTSLEFTTDIADRTLGEIRTANPTHSY